METWMNHPAMKNLDPVKLELLKRAAEQTKGKSGNALASVMLSLIVSANKQGIRFSQDEIDLILTILKEGKSETEKQHIDQMVSSVKKARDEKGSF
ncbi:MAG: hypothetical protein PUG71_09965 [bacterium]|nr:hypothetical protein [bacterium]